jgi:hypothetical protein
MKISFYDQTIRAEVVFTIDEDADIHEMTSSFERVLKAAGYLLPDNGYIDICYWETID